ncbi:MAG: hypothetical protein Tsb0013_14770 [Phycisphaerales bacterium]
MAPNNTRRGLQDIRTMAGRISGSGGKQRMFMRLATLELERVRREQEYQAASHRARLAWERVQKLQAEIDQIISSTGHSSAQGEGTLRPVVRGVQPGVAGASDCVPLRYGARRT